MTTITVMFLGSELENKQVQVTAVPVPGVNLEFSVVGLKTKDGQNCTTTSWTVTDVDYNIDAFLKESSILVTVFPKH